MSKRIKKFMILGVGFYFFMVSGLLPLNAAQQDSDEGSWEMIIQTKVTQPVRMAAFFDEHFGVTGGFSGSGKTHVTTDGGKTWTKTESSGGCIFGVEIIDKELVWVCGKMTGMSFSSPGGIRLSKDGGRTFEQQANFRTFPKECPMGFLGEKTGWVYQEGDLSATADGGQTWQTLPLPEEATKVKAVSPLSVEEGYILDETGMVFVTKDQGQTWESLPLPRKEFARRQAAKLEGTTAGLRFFDRENGLAVMSLVGEEEPVIVAFRTSDGGRNWQVEMVDRGMGSIFLTPDGLFITSYSREIKVYRYRAEERN